MKTFEQFVESAVKSDSDGPGHGRPLSELSKIVHMKCMSHHSHQGVLLKTNTHPDARYKDDSIRHNAAKYHAKMFKAHSDLST